MAVVAFVCLAASLAVGRVAYAGGSLERPLGGMALRGSAVALVALAMVSVWLAAVGLRGAVVDTDARVAAFSDQVARLDRSLRLAGEEGVAAREALFRYVDHMAREASPRSNPGVAAEPGGLVALRGALREAAWRAGLSGSGADGETGGALEGFLAAADGLSAGSACRSAPWCELALRGWLLVGLASLGLMAGTGRASLPAVVGMAVALSVVALAWEGGTAMFASRLLLSGERLETALYAIAD